MKHQLTLTIPREDRAMSKRRPSAFRAFFFVLLCMFISIGLLVGGAWFSYAKTQQLSAIEMRDVALLHQEVATQNGNRAPYQANPQRNLPRPPVAARAPFGPAAVQQLYPNATPPARFQSSGVAQVQAGLGSPAAANPYDSFVAKIKNALDDDSREEAIDQARAALEKHYDNYIDNYEKQVKEDRKSVV